MKMSKREYRDRLKRVSELTNTLLSRATGIRIPYTREEMQDIVEQAIRVDDIVLDRVAEHDEIQQKRFYDTQR